MRSKTKPISRQKKQIKDVPEKVRSAKKVNKRKPVTAQFWQSSLDAASDAVCFLDIDQRILHCNRAMEEMFGLKKKDIIGKHCWEIVHGSTKPIAKCPTTLAKKTIARGQGEIRKGNKWFNIIADPMLDKKGRIKGIVHTLQDITERKRILHTLKESEIKYRNLVENVSDVIFSVDIQGSITYISPAMEHLTGYSTSEITGTNITDHILPEDLPNVIASINRILASGRKESTEYRVKIKNGEIRHVISSSSIILKNGQPIGLTGIITDITQRKLAEEALKDAELKFRTIFNSASDGIILADTSNKYFVSANESICALLGYTKEELLKLNVSDIHPKGSLPFVIDQFEKLSKQKISMAHDIPVMKKDKTVFFADVNTSSIILDGKECLIGIFRDTTQRRIAEEELRESEKKYKLLAEKMSDIVWIMDLDLQTTYVSPSIQKVLGFTEEERLRQSIDEQLKPESLSIAKDTWHKELALERQGLLDSNKTITLILEFYHKDGSTRWLESTISGLRNKQGVLTSFHGVSRDITERKLAEEALKERDAVFRKLSANVPGMIYQFQRKTDGSYSIPFTTDAINYIFGCSPQDVVKDFSPIGKVIYPDDLEKVIDSIELSAKKMSHWECEFRVQIPGKPIRWLLGNSTPEKLPDGSIVWHGFCTDISERKLAEKALKERDAVFRKLSSNVPGIIYQFMMKPDGTFCIPFSTDAVKDIYGCSPEDIVNDFSPIAKVIYHEDLDRFINSIKLSAKNMSQWQCEYRVQVPGKSIRWVLGISTPEKLPDGSIIWHGFNTDITERKQMEESLRMTQFSIDHASYNLLWLDENANIVYVNESFISSVGYSREELLKMKIHDIDPDFTIDKWPSHLKELKKRRSMTFESCHIRKDGYIFPVEVNCNYFEYKGRFYSCAFDKDITERKQAERELQFKGTLLDSAADSIIVHDLSGRIVYANKAAEKLRGYSSGKMIGKNIYDFSTPEFVDLVDKRIAEIKEKGEIIFETRSYRLDGSSFPIEVHALLVSNNEEMQILRIGRDITDRKNAEHQRNERMKELRAFFNLATITEKENTNLSDIYQGLADVLPESWQYPEITCCRIVVDNKEYQSKNFKESEWMQSSPFKVYGVIAGKIEIGYLAEKPQDYEGPFMNEERQLLDTIAERLGHITERMQAKEVLQQKNLMLARTEQIAHIGSWEWDIERDKVSWSEELFLIFQRDPALGAPSFAEHPSIYLAEDMELLRQAVELCVSEGIPYELEMRGIRADGQIRHCIARGHAHINAEGKIYQLYGSLQDITERKQMEDLIKQSEAKYRLLADNMKDFVWLLDLNLKMTYASPSIGKLVGYSYEEVMNLPMNKLLTKRSSQDVINVFKKEMEKALAEPSDRVSLELECLRKDGQIIWVEATFSFIMDKNGKPMSILGEAREITERKHIEEALRRNELMFRTLFESSPVGVFLVKDRTFAQVNSALCNITGYPPEELVEQSVGIGYADDEEYERVGSILYEQVTKNGIGSTEALCRRKNGEIFYALLFLTQIDPEDSSLGYEGIMVDIDERKKADEKLKLEQQRFRSLTESSSDIILVLNTNGIVTYMNPAIEQVLGYKPEERIGKNGMEFVHPDDLQSMVEKFNILVNSTKYSVLHDEIRLRHKDGSWHIFETTGNNLVKDNVVEAIIVRQHDITDRKRMEDAIRRSEEDFRSLFEQSLDGIIINDQFRIIEVNHAFSVLSGFPIEEIIGKKPLDFIHPDDREIAAQRLEQRQKGLQSPEGYIYRAIRADGSIALVDLRSKLIEWKGKQAFLTIIRDITEQRYAEEALRSSEEKFKSIVSTSQEWIWAIDVSGIHTYSNSAVENILGYHPDEIVGDKDLLENIIHKEDFQNVEKLMASSIALNKGWANVVSRWRHKDGTYRFLESNAVPIFDEKRNLKGFQGSDHDITERKQAEESLRASEEKYRGIFDESITAIYIFDTKKNFIDSNQAGLDLLGYSREELMKLSIPDVDIDPVVVLPAHQELFDGGRLINYEHRLRRKDGTIITVLNNSRPLTDATGNTIGMLSTLIDITERKKAEKDLRESETKLKAVIQGSPVPQFVIDQHHHIIHWNKALEEISGIKAVDVLGTSKHWQAFYATDRPCLGDLLVDGKTELIPELYKGKYNESKYSEGAYEGTDFFSTMGNKEGKWLFFSAAPIKDTQGNVIGAVETLQDITDRKSIENKLQESEERYRRITENMSDFVSVLDAQGVFKYNSPSIQRILGYDPEELIGSSGFDLIHPEDRDFVIATYMDGINTESDRYVEQRYRRKDGSYIWLRSSGRIFYGPDHKNIGMIVNSNDISDRKKAEIELEKYRQHLEELVHERTIHLEASNKELEAFSYSASHDLRAPLRSIEGFSQALLEDYQDKLDTQGRDYLTRIKLATRRMADLIEDMLQLSRITRMEMVVEKIDLTTIARSVIIDLQKSQPQRSVKVKISEGLEDKADLRLTRIIMDNLLRNAWKFTEKQEKATIDFGLWKKEGEKNIYFIRDNGAGFDMAYADKLFAPFQRLHADDEFPGTGIGLATVRRILNRHGGKIWAESETGKGATFYFTFSEK